MTYCSSAVCSELKGYQSLVIRVIKAEERFSARQFPFTAHMFSATGGFYELDYLKVSKSGFFLKKFMNKKNVPHIEKPQWANVSSEERRMHCSDMCDLYHQEDGHKSSSTSSFNISIWVPTKLQHSSSENYSISNCWGFFLLSWI